MTAFNRIIPNKLVTGNRIGIVAPAGPFDADKFAAGCQVLVNLGFEPVVPGDLMRKTGYLAGDDAHRVSLLHQMFADPSIDAVHCARGGYGCMRLLPLIDFAMIRRHPKIFIGFSDITVLLTVFYMQAGLVTFHGPVVTSLGTGTPGTRQALTAAVSHGQSLEIISENGYVLKPGVGDGSVIGGNLTLLAHLTGTPYMPRYAGHILFLEDCNEPPYRIDRMLTQLRLAGCLEGIAGLMLGQFNNCGSLDELKAIVTDIFQDQDIPILGGFDIGHESTNLTLPIGLPARLDTDARRLTYLEAAVS